MRLWVLQGVEAAKAVEGKATAMHIMKEACESVDVCCVLGGCRE